MDWECIQSSIIRIFNIYIQHLFDWDILLLLCYIPPRTCVSRGCHHVIHTSIALRRFVPKLFHQAPSLAIPHHITLQLVFIVHAKAENRFVLGVPHKTELCQFAHSQQQNNTTAVIILVISIHNLPIVLVNMNTLPVQYNTVGHACMA